jgi:outer membrane biosynthesis protein TonB
MGKEQNSKPSWDNFTVKNTFDDDEEVNTELEEENEEVEENEEEQEEEEAKPGKKDKKEAKVKPTKKDKKAAEEEESESEEEEEEVPVGKKDTKTAKTKTKVEEVVEDEDEQEEEDQPEEGGSEVETAKEFFEEVARITGNDIEVEYGDVDPLTPQGVALRENAIKASAVDGVLEEIETKYPKVFKALQVASAGGDVAELFKVAAGKDYSKVTIGDEDEAAAKQILTEYYKTKGISSEKKLATLIAEDEDSEQGLVAEAKKALKELQDNQAAEENKILAAQKAKNAEDEKKDKILLTAIDEVIQGGKLGNWKFASKQDAAEFKKFLDGKIRKTRDGGYEFGISIEPANLEKTLQYMFFAKNKGDLTKFVQIKAGTQNANKLKLSIAKETATDKTKATGQETGKRKLSLKDFTVTE